MRAAGCRRRGGPRELRLTALSLIEVVASVAISAVVLGATVSTVHVLTRSGAAVVRTADQQTALNQVMFRMRREIGLAVTVTEMTGETIAFTHPDTSGDGVDELIRYAWSGTAGDPLTRQINGGAAQALLAQCSGLSLKVTMDATLGPTESQVDTTEMLLGGHDQYPLLYVYLSGNSRITPSKYTAQYFTADYPGAASFSVTRVKVSMKRDVVTDGNVYVAVRPVKPGTHVPCTGVPNCGECKLIPNSGDCASRPVAALSTSYLWEEFSFGAATGLVPGAGYTILASSDTSVSRSFVEYHGITLGNCDDGTEGHMTTDSGSTWTPADGDQTTDARVLVYGRFQVPDPSGAPAIVEGQLKTVYFDLQTQEGGRTARLRGATDCVNRPEMAGLAYEDMDLATP